MSDRHRHLRAVPDPGSPEADVDALAEPLGEWLADQHPDLTVEIVREPLVFAVTLLRELGDPDITAWSPDVVEQLLSLCDEELPRDQFGFLNLVLAVTLDFLTGTGRWTGTDEEAGECAAMFGLELDMGLEASLEESADARPPAAEEDAALARLPMVQETEALLRWIGPSRKVTGTGRVTRKDLAGAAAALGIDLPSAPQPGKADGQESVDLGAVPAPLPRNLNARNIPRLEAAWARLEAAELLERTGGTVRPTSFAAPLLGEDPAARLEARRELVVMEVAGRVVQWKTPGMLPAIGELLIALLAAACSGTPVRSDMIDELFSGAPDTPFSGATVTIGLDGPETDDDPVEVDDVLADLLATVVRAELDGLVDIRLLDLSHGNYTIPEALRSAVAHGLLEGLALLAQLDSEGLLDTDDLLDPEDE